MLTLFFSQCFKSKPNYEKNILKKSLPTNFGYLNLNSNILKLCCQSDNRQTKMMQCHWIKCVT